MQGTQVKYVHKEYIVDAIQMDEAFSIETMAGTHYGRKGDYLCTNEKSDQFIVTREYFESNFIRLDIVDDGSVHDRTFVYDYIKQLEHIDGWEEMNKIKFNQKEDEQYIKGTKEIAGIK